MQTTTRWLSPPRFCPKQVWKSWATSYRFQLIKPILNVSFRPAIQPIPSSILLSKAFVTRLDFRPSSTSHLRSGTVAFAADTTSKAEKYDLIVVGYGAAGAAAAITAAEKGASVLILDRGYGGGASALSGGIFYAGGGTPYQKAAGYEDTPENMFNYLQQEVKGAVDDETLRTFCDSSVENLAWLEQRGARFQGSLCPYKTSYPTDKHYLYFSGNEKAHPYNLHSKPAPRGHRTFGPSLDCGAILWQALQKSAKALGVQFQPLSRVDKLIVENGRVAGVSFKTIPESNPAFRRHRRLATPALKLTNFLASVGNILNSRAERIWRQAAVAQTVHAKSIILAAGGFVFNHSMRQQYAPKYAQVSSLGTIGDDGTGIRLGQDTGGQVTHMDRITAWRFLSPPSALIEGVTVGLSGERIMNEDLYGATHSEVLIHKFDGRGYLIVDSTIWKKAINQLQEQCQDFQRLQFNYLRFWDSYRAHSLSALASKLGVSASGLEATVNAYNDGIRDGSGDPFRKAADLCSPISKGPFYGIDISIRPSPLYFVPGVTLGGLQVDGKSGLVMTDSGKTIPGLYAAGRNAVGVSSNSYVSGLSLADCIFSGRRAGQHAMS
ncbi:FAD/NAD(P)-binding domain-containing protein [Mytilinidion resinicola]|uniref:FAD/NAD(P)-binding domain-containing protein n=1 Tax=Mytilinidion resinicola TaxID=574789 RepID=A0A6A6Z7E3_9PEZI|nr:FAD/NAD(P)-binding domain-containing protein [Mytilinidion resinicola]KAF2816157.1 FAD/NAD(P)-binding domain-containing protein [Mytilinidion resinicola]